MVTYRTTSCWLLYGRQRSATRLSLCSAQNRQPPGQSCHHKLSTTLPTLQPSAERLYINMNNVDRADQLAVYYSFERKTWKWWRKVFFWLIETIIVNSYVIYHKIAEDPCSHLAYHRRVLEILPTRYISSVPLCPRSGCPSKSPV